MKVRYEMSHSCYGQAVVRRVTTAADGTETVEHHVPIADVVRDANEHWKSVEDFEDMVDALRASKGCIASPSTEENGA